MTSDEESSPRPVRIRLFNQTDRQQRRPVGHWYLRIDPSRHQGWKLSFWYPDFDWAGRRRLDGQGWDQASATFVSTFYDLALPTHQQYEQTISELEKALTGPQVLRPGFRPGSEKRFLSSARQERTAWRAYMQDIALRYSQFIVDNGWPEAVLPAWPWEGKSG